MSAENAPKSFFAYFPSLVFWAIPLFFLPSLADPVSLPRTFGLVICSLVLLFGLKKFHLPQRKLYLGLGIWLLAGALSLGLAQNLPEGFFELGRMGLYVGWFFVLWNGVRENRIELEGWARGAVVALLLQVFIGFAQWADLAFTGLGSNGMPAGLFLNPNLYAEALLVTLPFGLWLFGTSSGTWKWLALAASIGAVALIFAAGSRGVLAGLIVGAVAYGAGEIALRNREWIFPRLFRLVFAGMILLISLGGIGAWVALPGTTLAEKRDGIESLRYKKVVSSVEERWALWYHSAEMTAEHPLTGVGAGNWKFSILKYGMKSDFQGYATRLFLRPHNDFFWVASELGVLGLIGFVGFWLLVVWVGLQRLTGPGGSRTEALFLAGILGMGIVSCFGFPKERVFTYAVLLSQVVFLLGPARNWGKDARPALKWGLLILFLPVLVLGMLRMPGEFRMRKMLEAHEAGQLAVVIREGKEIDTRFSPVEPVAGGPVAFYIGTAQLGLGRAGEAQKSLLAAEEVSPFHPHILHNLASAFQLEGNPSKAELYYRKAIEVFPDFEDAALNLSITLLQSGRVQEARAALELVPIRRRTRKQKEILDVIESASQTD